MGKEVKYFCDVCDAEMQSDTAYIVKVSGDGWESQVYVCKGHYDALKGTS